MPVLHKKITFLIGPDVAPHFYKAPDMEMSQEEVRTPGYTRAMNQSQPVAHAHGGQRTLHAGVQVQRAHLWEGRCV